NASIHKGRKIEELARQYNARLMYLPAYSPDLNPIEKAWSILKKKSDILLANNRKLFLRL
uniref:transposase n=1 Tax=uncultured Acinetobacter sp. TaxID=165433 RepID=UPI00258FE6F2